MSASDGDVPKNARKDFEKALDEAAKGKLPDAATAMQKAASGYRKFASAWLGLGMLQASQNQTANALESYSEAIVADDKFAAPYIESAVLEAVAGQWDKVAEHTDRANSLDPDSFALAYYLNAMANIRLTKADAADKSATEGLRVDHDHEYPDLAYIQGLLLMSKGEQQGARKQFEDYLALAPNGLNAANARQELMDLPVAK
jgi:tetratricopeptide (TPR) repeat protein